MTPLMYARIALVLAIFAAGAYSGYRWESSRIGPLQAEISRLQARDTIMENANAQCAANVKAANEATDRLKQAGQARAAKATEALKTASATAAAQQATIDDLMSRKAPVDLSCVAQSDAAAKLISDEIRGRE